MNKQSWILFWFMSVLTASPLALSQSKEGGGQMSCCEGGMHAMGIAGMILGGILIVSIIAALVALTVFLFRKSHSHT